MKLMMMMRMMIMRMMMMLGADKTNGPTAIMKMLFRFLNITQYGNKN